MNNNKKAVFLITIDALRKDHLKPYGYSRDTAPNLTHFCKKATIFTQAFSNGPETPSSFSSIFTSTLPFLDGGYSPLPPQKTSFVELLNENKIFTYGIHSNPNLGRFFNYDKGFEIFLDGERYKSEKISHLSIKESISYHLKKILKFHDIMNKALYRLKGFNKIKVWIRKKIPKLTDLLLPFTPIAYNAPYLVNKILSFLSTFNDNDLFLWAHFMDIHSPYNPPLENYLKFSKKPISDTEREFLTIELYNNPHKYKITKEVIKKLIDLYDGEINFMDEYLGKLLYFIEKKYGKNCLIIITADHGESFFEHGYFNHQGNIFDELLKVPLILIEFNNDNHPKIVNETVQLLDIAPTILDYFSLEIPDYYQGRSLLPLLRNELIHGKELIISECYQKGGYMKRNEKEGFKLISIRTNDCKYIYDEEKNQEFLFNLKTDPLERDNLINKNPEKAREFRLIRDFHLQKAKETQERSRIVSAIDKLNLKK